MVSGELDDDSSSSNDLSESISGHSVADFICYSIHEGKRLVTVVLETKQMVAGLLLSSA